MSRIDWHDVRAKHSMVAVVRRSGIYLRADGGDVTINCPMPGHDDTTPSMVLHLDSDRYYCFGCGAHGDVIQWTQDLERVSAVEAARILDGDGQLTVPASATAAERARGSAQNRDRPATSRPGAERPDLGRTPPERVRAALQAAWAYYCCPSLHRRGVDYLTGRNIDVAALEAELGHPVIGHTPAQGGGLVAHLANHGFGADELVDAGLACRYPDGRYFDFFRHRAIVAVRDDSGRLAGLVGRATRETSGPKYLNMSRTGTCNKAKVIYRPATQVLDRHANVIVCEGTLDALAIAAQAAASGLSHCYAPVALSGLTLSDHQLAVVLAMHPLPLVFAGDGDLAGGRAIVEWATRAALAGRESVCTIWPDDHDPASWIGMHGENGLLALTRKGCLEPNNTGLRPRHAGEIIAQAALRQAKSGLVSLEDALATALAPYDNLQGAAAARYVGAACKTFAPVLSIPNFETLQQRRTDPDRLRQTRRQVVSSRSEQRVGVPSKSTTGAARP